MLRSLPFALLALALAAPALADGVPPPEGGPRHHGSRYHGPRHAHPAPYPVHRPRPVVPHGFVRHDVAPPVGPAYYGWPEPAEVRVPIYNRPTLLPANY